MDKSIGYSSHTGYAVVQALRSMSEAEIVNFGKKLDREQDLLEDLYGLYLDTIEPPVSQPRKTFLRLAESEIGVPEELTNAVLNKDKDLVSALLFEEEEDIASKYCYALMQNGYNLEAILDVRRDEQRLLSFWSEGERLGTGRLIPNIAHECKDLMDDFDARHGIKNEGRLNELPQVSGNPLRLMCHLNPNGHTDPEKARAIKDPLNLNGPPVFFDHRYLAKCDIPIGDYIDLKRGCGQYISDATSRIILHDIYPGNMDRRMSQYVNSTFARLKPHERMEKLREVFHTAPSKRGGYELFSYRKENIIFLAYKGRLLTLGRISGLPRHPDYIRPVTNNGPDRAYVCDPNPPLLRMRNSFSSLEDEETA